jgi:oxygen-independent coproporphyrinogen-3 oxidase
MLGLSGIKSLVNIISDYLDFEQLEEITFETNPETLSEEIVSYLSEIPKIRLSIGIQRLQNDELILLGRYARINSIIKALDYSFSSIDNISGDFIIGVPNCRSIASDLQKLILDYPFKHISTYFLTLEEGTPLQEKVKSGKLQNTDDIGPEEMFEVEEVLKKNSFDHYEISNYAKKGYSCKHNLGYWKTDDYIGFGPSAVSCINHTRYFEISCFEKWLNGILPEKEQLTKIDQRNEFLMLNLRLLKEGLDIDVFEKKFGVQKEDFYINLNHHISSGKIIQSGNKIRLSNLGVVMANSIISDLFV